VTGATWPALDRPGWPAALLFLLLLAAAVACPARPALAAPGRTCCPRAADTLSAATATTRGEVEGATAGDPQRDGLSVGERRAGCDRVAPGPKGVDGHAATV
jgi:hypothetical protein